MFEVYCLGERHSIQDEYIAMEWCENQSRDNGYAYMINMQTNEKTEFYNGYIEEEDYAPLYSEEKYCADCEYRNNCQMQCDEDLRFDGIEDNYSIDRDCDYTDDSDVDLSYEPYDSFDEVGYNPYTGGFDEDL